MEVIGYKAVGYDGYPGGPACQVKILDSKIVIFLVFAHHTMLQTLRTKMERVKTRSDSVEIHISSLGGSKVRNIRETNKGSGRARGGPFTGAPRSARRAAAGNRIFRRRCPVSARLPCKVPRSGQGPCTLMCHRTTSEPACPARSPNMPRDLARKKSSHRSDCFSVQERMTVRNSGTSSSWCWSRWRSAGHWRDC